jgi:hypothetical protein
VSFLRLTNFISPQVGSPVAFYFPEPPNFAANQLVNEMDVITVETKAFKELMAKINVIASYVFSRQDDCKENEDDIWVDSYEVCTFLKISDRTLQRLRSKGEIAYSTIRGRNFYKIGEIKRLLESRLIKSNDECMRNLITNHKLYVKERRNLREDK